MQDRREKVRVVSAEAAPTLDVFGATLSVLADGSNMAMVAGEHTVPPGYGVPLHVHAVDDELFYMLDGALTVTGPQGEMTVQAGACVQLPHGIPHAFRNGTQAPARFLAILRPGLQALAMFRHFDAAAGAAAVLTPQDIASVAAQHGVRFV